MKKFRNLALAYEAIQLGGNMPCIINAANEVAVDAFLHDRISFLGMSELIEKTMQKAQFIKTPVYEDYVQTDEQTRCIAKDMLNIIK
jgi:1-deoxy-D-xylulose-5-phosphate reductoisomerase